MKFYTSKCFNRGGELIREAVGALLYSKREAILFLKREAVGALTIFIKITLPKGGFAVVDELTYYYRAEQDIENYATYEISVAGYTVAGDGPSEKHLVGKSSYTRGTLI